MSINHYIQAPIRGLGAMAPASFKEKIKTYFPMMMMMMMMIIIILNLRF
jgi:hypothetical protein